MGIYKVTPIYKNGQEKYNAPAFYAEASNQNEATKQSGLSRFPEWDFHVIDVNKIMKRPSWRTKKPSIDPKSKSQLGKIKTGHQDSRPVRRGLRRLASASGNTEKGCRKAGAIKMW